MLISYLSSDVCSSDLTLDFRQPGDLIYLIGESRNDIASSQYLYSWHKVKKSPAPFFDLDKEFEVQQAIKNLILENLIDSAHDVSDGGLYISLLESAIDRKSTRLNSSH